MTSARSTFCMTPLTSSWMTHLPNFWQARQPRQNWMFLPASETFSTSCPAAAAPATNCSASMSLLDPVRKLVDITITFFIVFYVVLFTLQSYSNSPTTPILPLRIKLPIIQSTT